MIRLVAIDLDGTLLDEHNQISTVNKEAIRQTEEKGVQVVLSSGRTTGNLLDYLEELNLSGDVEYVVGYNGALVMEARTKRILHEDMIPVKDVLRITKLLDDMDAFYSVHTLEEVLVPRTHSIARYEAKVNGMPLVVKHPRELPADAKVPKIIILDEPERLDQHEKALPSWLKEEYTLVRSQEMFLDVLKQGVSKFRGVRAVALELGVATEEILAIGDAENDRVLLTNAGIGVAMGNATPEIQGIADFITRTNAEDGVAYALHRYIGLDMNEI